MRQLLAALVLFCFGITVPSAALTMRVCLLEGSSTAGQVSTTDHTDDRGCSDCCKKDKSCCAELKKLPDSTIRSGDAELPDLVVMDLPPLVFRVSLDAPSVQRPFQPAVAIRGPDSPARRRPLLAVWII